MPESDTNILDELANRVAALLVNDQSSPWLSAPEAATYLRFPLKRVYNLTAASAIPHHRQGGRIVFHRAELDDWLEGFYYGPLRRAV
jgi:excisionase family DNA binding protein